MRDVFNQASLAHAAGPRHTGTAAFDVLSPDDFAKAIAEISRWPGYAPTPLLGLDGLAGDLGLDQVLYKHEGPRFGLGSFKALGGSYAALRVLQRVISKQVGQSVDLGDIRAGKYADLAAKITLVSATDGNHGRSLAWGCQRFGVPCRIYIHAKVNPGRAEAMRALGAKVVRVNGDYDASVDMARNEADANGWYVVSDTSWPGYSEPPRDVMAGYGVMSFEICKTLPSAPSHVFLQGGVGGLPASVAAALRQYWGSNAPRVVVVEPELAPCLFASAKSDRATSVKIKTETIMAGLSCGKPSGMAWEILRQEASDFLTIPDNIVAPTIRLLARPIKADPPIEAGESGVAGLAGLIAACRSGQMRQTLGLNAASRVLLIGSEGVTAPEIFKAIMAGADHA